MQKKIIALAVAGLATSGAFAQSNVEVYGLVDLSVVSYSGTYSGLVGGTQSVANPNGVFNGVGKSAHTATGIEYGSRAELANGMNATSRLGFRGTEKLGNGLSASFVIESSIAGDGSTAAGSASAPTANILGDRETTVSLSNSYGSVKLGRQNLVSMDIIDGLDLFDGGVGVIQNLIVNPLSSTRVSNAIRFDSTVMGVELAYQYAMSENSDRLNNTRGVGAITNMTASYTAGPLFLTAGHLLARDFGNGLTPDTTGLAGANATAAALAYRNRSLSYNHLGASYDFGIAKLNGQYVTTTSTKTASDEANPANIAAANAATALNLMSWVGTGQPLINSSTYMLGLTVPMGAHKLLGSFVSTNDKRNFNQDARSLTLGYEYGLSKRTTLYARGSKVNNVNGATFGMVGDQSVALAQTGATLNRTAAYLAGIKHTF